MDKEQKVLAMVSIIIIYAVAAIIDSQDCASHKIISYASDQYYDHGGSLKVEKDFLGINYSFSCGGVGSAD